MVFENRINFSIHTLILSAHALIVSGNAISLFAHALIAPENPIRIRAHTLIASTLPSNTAYSSTVPGGDTPCLTAGDAQRANPWIGDAQTSDASGVAQQPQHLLLVFIFCCHIVTSSLLEYSHLKTYTLRA